jgi:hypothetical protein
MKKHNLYISLIFLILSLFINACRKKVEPTTTEKISKTWRVSRATFNGQNDNASLYSTFRLRLTTDGNYTVIVGNAPAKPNRTNANLGRWVLEGNDTQIIMDKGTPNEGIIFLVGVPTDQNLNIRFRQDRLANKTEPEYTFDLIPE